MPAYAGVGSRETPPEVQETMERLAADLAALGWTLRSGAAPGADAAFERGCGAGPKEVFIPWSGFEGRRTDQVGIYLVPEAVRAEAEARSREAHPAWSRLTQGGRKLQTRNVCQLLGADLASPVGCVLCWTKGGRGAGGAGQAIRLARASGIPVFDMGFPGGLEAAKEWVSALQP